MRHTITLHQYSIKKILPSFFIVTRNPNGRLPEPALFIEPFFLLYHGQHHKWAGDPISDATMKLPVSWQRG